MPQWKLSVRYKTVQPTNLNIYFFRGYLSPDFSSGYRLTIFVSEWPFGSSSVRIDIETANGYRDSSTVSTAVPGTPSRTFNIPPNQGNSVNVCTDPSTRFRKLCYIHY
jgi:hypothetical protein